MGMQLLHLFAAATLFAAAQSQFPPGCTCPDRCDCNTTVGTIDCKSQGLTYVPAEINSCAWARIRRVDLSNNAITGISALAFSQLENITHLFLYDNFIERIDPDAFVGLHSLQFLFLDGNQLRELHHTVFRSLTKLERLLLYSNRLEALPVGVFSELSNLTTLALHDNQLAVLNRATFDDLHSLQQLYLHANRIIDVSNSPFRSLRQLTRLHLNNNRLTRLTRFDFLGLESLTALVASDNEISLIEDETFNPLLNLLELNLQNNRVTSINRLVFAGPVELLELDLRSNDVDIISDGAFFRLTNLRKLFLHDNNIGELKKQIFVGLNSLRELYLHSNDISSILNSCFVHLPQLEQLWLYDNQISCLEPGAFQGLSRVYILNLGDNELFYLPEEVFQPLENIVYLLLYGNQFKSIDNKPFRNLTRLLQLNFYFNDIRYISEGAMDGSDRLLHFQWNSENDLSKDNALICDCSSRWLYQWMNSRLLYSKVFCGAPEQFRGQEIRSLQDANFGCNSISLQVSVGPSCESHVVRRRGCLVLECSSNPRAPVQWSRVDGRELRRIVPHSCSTGSCQSESVLLGEGDGVLVVENMQTEDAGYYECTATIEGTVASQICKVTVGDPPEILNEPKEDLLLSFPGSPAKFSLSVAGDPPPTVQWYYSRNGNSELDVPIVETGPDSRYLVGQSGTLMILETRLEDQGTYTAVVSNGAGEVRVKTHLEFYFSTPCRSDCLNGGVCTTTPVHFCSCPKGYLGRYCEEYTDTDSPTLPAPDTTSDSVTVKPPDYVSYSGSAYTYSGDYSGYDEGFREKRTLRDDSELLQDLEMSSEEEEDIMMPNVIPTTSKLAEKRNKSLKQNWNENSLYPYHDGLTSYGPKKTGKHNRDTLVYEKATYRYGEQTPMPLNQQFNNNKVDVPLNEELHQLASSVE